MYRLIVEKMIILMKYAVRRIDGFDGLRFTITILYFAHFSLMYRRIVLLMELGSIGFDFGFISCFRLPLYDVLIYCLKFFLVKLTVCGLQTHLLKNIFKLFSILK